MLSPSDRQVTHALLTRPPLSFPNFLPKNSFQKFSLDLHVLGTPPAFVLSQDQTLDYIVIFKAFRLFIYSLDRFSALSNTNVFVKFAKNFFGIDKVYTLCNCRNSLALASYCYRFFTVYFSNIILSLRQLIYYITFSLSCQELFSRTFKFLFPTSFCDTRVSCDSFGKFFNRLIVMPCCLSQATTFLVYHFFFALSRTFFGNFLILPLFFLLSHLFP